MPIQTTLPQPTQNLELLGQQQRVLAGTPAPQIADTAKIASDLGLVGPADLKVESKKVDPAFERQANDFVAQLLEIKVGDAEAEDQGQLAVEQIGRNIVGRVSANSELLQQPLKRLGQIGGGEGQGIADALTDLKTQFDEIDPSRFDFNSGWLGRSFSWLPMVGKPINRYFTRFEASGKVIEALFDSIELSKQQLLRDISSLRGDQVSMRASTKALQDLITTCHIIDEKLSEKVAGMDQSSEEAKYINTKLIFRIRQRITDLQQQLIVNQQGILMFEVLMESNRELVRGVDRCKSVTYPALMIGITAAQAIANQRIVLTKLVALDEIGNRTIAYNAQLLKGQAIEINKKAASAQLSDQGLAQAMKSAIEALNDVEQFRLQALGQMKAAIVERTRLAEQGEKAIKGIERGHEAAITLGLDNEFKVTGAKNR